jgi:hypothetical protein
MNALVECKIHIGSFYVAGNGCLVCYIEQQEVRARHLTLAARLRDSELYVDASDEAADVLDALEVFVMRTRRGIAELNQVTPGFDKWDKLDKQAIRLLARLQGKKK